MEVWEKNAATQIYKTSAVLLQTTNKSKSENFCIILMATDARNWKPKNLTDFRNSFSGWSWLWRENNATNWAMRSATSTNLWALSTVKMSFKLSWPSSLAKSWQIQGRLTLRVLSSHSCLICLSSYNKRSKLRQGLKRRSVFQRSKASTAKNFPKRQLRAYQYRQSLGSAPV